MQRKVSYTHMVGRLVLHQVCRMRTPRGQGGELVAWSEPRHLLDEAVKDLAAAEEEEPSYQFFIVTEVYRSRWNG